MPILRRRKRNTLYATDVCIAICQTHFILVQAVWISASTLVKRVVILRRRIAVENEEETMEKIEDNNSNYVTVDREYLAELEEKATRTGWLEGYIEGVDDTLNHLVELLQAYKGN